MVSVLCPLSQTASQNHLPVLRASGPSGRCIADMADHAEWQHTDRLRMALTPLLIGPDLYRVALPILYVHPVVSHKTIPAFARSVKEASLYLNGDFPKSCLVRHLTIRPSPIVPSAELPKKAHGAGGSAQATSYTVHPQLKDALSPLRDLQSFTLKEAMILHQPDAAVLFSALSVIAPKKARLEFRMWDLNDSSLGEELLSMTQASSYSSLARYANRALGTTVGDRNARVSHDTYRQPLLEAWRDALLKGTEFEAPTWWLEGPGDNNNGNGAAGQVPAVAHAGPAMLVPPPIPPSSIGPPGPHIPNAARFEPVDPLGEDERRAMYYTAYREPVGEPIGELRGRELGRNVHLSPIPQSRHSLEMRSAMPSVGPSSNDEDASSTASTPHSPRPAHAQLQAPHNPIGGLRSEEQETSELMDETVAAPSAAQRSHIAASARQSQAIRGVSRGTLPPVIPNHRTQTNVPLVLHEGHVRGSVPPPRPRSPRSNAEHSRLRRRMPHLDHTPFIARPSPAAGVEGSERSSLSTHDAGLTSHPLAHRVREQLRELLGHWTPALQALSIVAFDPLSTLIVRAPQLDFWTSVAVPHIRVQLPRACHALGIFQGTREAARARQRLREAEEGQVINPIQQAWAQVQALALLQGQSPPSTLTPAQIQVLSAAQFEEERLVGGDGNGGGLVNEDVKLFEIEVNTRLEMGDDVWIRYGHQLPPQVCRILAGAPEHDWSSVPLGELQDYLLRHRWVTDEIR